MVTAINVTRIKTKLTRRCQAKNRSIIETSENMTKNTSILTSAHRMKPSLADSGLDKASSRCLLWVVMNKEFFRAVALTIVLLTLITLSGTSASATLLIEAGQHTTCCDHAAKDGSEQEDPCTLADCSCCTGITLLHSKHADLCQFFASRTLPSELTDRLKLSACYHAIEYPPECS